VHKTSDQVELKIPAEPEYIQVAKRVAQSMGSRLGFSLEELDELTIAVAEACDTSIMSALQIWDSGASIKLTYSPNARGIAVEVEAVGPRPAVPLKPAVPAPEADDLRLLTQEVIRVLVDEYRASVDHGRGRVRMRMVKYLIS
jgi:serine/threonine-protein kinase RsbW